MRYDIVPIRSAYRGIGRCLTVEDFGSVQGKKERESLLDLYFAYIEDTLKPESSQNFSRMRDYCAAFYEAGVRCELIVCDWHPLDNAYGMQLDFLGIDIVHEMAESLLENGCKGAAKSLLNQNLLCCGVDDIPKVAALCDCGDVAWLPCWVYRVK